MPSVYDNESFMQSLAASEGDVKRQVDNAFGEIERRRNLAHTKLGEARTEQGRVFDYTNQDFGNSMGQMRGNLDRFGGLFKGIQAYDTSGFDKALGTMRGGFGEAMGLMGQGFDEQSVQRQGAATSIRDQLLNDLVRQRNEYVSRREGEDRAAEEQRKAAELQRLHEIELANIQAAAMGGGGGGGFDLASLYGAPVEESAPAMGMAPSTGGKGRSFPGNIFGGQSRPLDNIFGGSRDQAAAEAGVDPYALVQNPDGSWSIQGGSPMVGQPAPVTAPKGRKAIGRMF